MVIDMTGDNLDRFGRRFTDEPSVSPYTIRDAPLGTSRHVRIVGIGAGASGINLVRTLRLNLVDYEVVIYERNADVGGTWFEQQYPGCRCDVPSHSYQFSWRPKHDWSNFFSPADEIRSYLRQTYEDERMEDSIKTLHQVTSARWDEDSATWQLVVQNLQTGQAFEDHADFLINGTGILK